jgi:hypothetical protein
LIEPTISDEGNLAKYPLAQACHYTSNGKNQYRIILPSTGETTPDRIFAANYRQRTPVQEQGWTFPVWEQHNISATAIGIVINSDLKSILYTGHSDGKIKIQDTGKNDDGDAIDWSINIGWTRTSESPFTTHLLTRIMGYVAQTGNYNITMSTNFDFGNQAGNVYSLPIVSQGSVFDTALFDTDVWGGNNPLSLFSISCNGDYKFIDVTFSGNVVDEILELHTWSMLFHVIEGLRDA